MDDEIQVFNFLKGLLVQLVTYGILVDSVLCSFFAYHFFIPKAHMYIS